MIRLKYCSFETAKALKEIGFKLPLSSENLYYNESGNIHPYKWFTPIELVDYIDAIPLALAQMWIREKFKIIVESNYLPNIEKYRTFYKPMNIIPKEFKSRKEYYFAVEKYYDRTSYDTYDDALEVGINKAIEIIKNELCC